MNAPSDKTVLASSQLTDAPPDAAPAGASARFGTTDLALITMSLIWGMNFIFVKAALSEIAPLAFVALRFSIAGVLLFLIVRWREGRFRIARRDLGWVILLGIVGTSIYQPLFINGLALTTASNSALILALTPTCILLLNRLLGRERVTRRGWLGVVVALGGMALIVGTGTDWLNRETLLGDALVFIGMICWAVYSVLAPPVLNRNSSMSVTALSTIVGALTLLVIGFPAIAAENWSAVGAEAWVGLAYSSVLAIAIGYLLWNLGLKRIGSARTAIYNNLTPVVATFGAALFLNEPLTPTILAGALCIFVGLFLARTATVVIEPEG